MELDVSPGHPVLYGHIIKRIAEKGLLKKICEWASEINNKNGYPPLQFETVKSCYKLWNKMKSSRYQLKDFWEKCRREAHSQQSSTTDTTPPSILTPTTSQEKTMIWELDKKKQKTARGE